MDHRIKDDMEFSERCRQIHELLDSAAVHHDSPSLDEAIKEPDHTKQQTPSVYEMNEAQIEIQRLQSGLDSINAYNRNLERDNAKLASVVSENQELRGKLDALEKSLEAKDDLQRMNEQLTTKLSESLSALEQMTGLSQRLTSRNQHTERELEELRTKLDAAEKDRDWHRKKQTEILDVCNTIKAACAPDNKSLVQEKSRLEQENDGLRQENSGLKKENSRLKGDRFKLDDKLFRHYRDIANFITQLDLAAESVRAYTCSHRDLKKIIPKSDKSTRIKPMSLIANEMYQHWADDESFRTGYQYAKKAICEHHSAHERAGHGNGDSVSRIQSVFKETDRRRGILQPSS